MQKYNRNKEIPSYTDTHIHTKFCNPIEMSYTIIELKFGIEIKKKKKKTYALFAFSSLLLSEDVALPDK